MSSENSSAMSLRPLAGVRVIEVGADPAAAFGCRILADLGAEVIKIEPPGAGDPTRREGPFLPGEGGSALFGYLNFGKRSVTLDITRPSGARLLGQLLGRSDVLVRARPDPDEPDTDQLLEGVDARPVVVAVSPYGLTGPGAGRAGSPFIVQHSGGFALHQACPVGDPARLPPVACADREGPLTVGLVVAIGALWGLEVVRTGNEAPLVDVSAEDVFAHLLVEPYAGWLKSEGREPFTRRRRPGASTAIVGGLVWLLPCADGHVLISPREDHQWERWMEVMGRPAWSHDAALCGDRALRTRHAATLQRLMAEWSIQLRCIDIFPAAQAARVACFPISTAADLLRNPQLHDRGFFLQLKGPDGAQVAMPGLPFVMEDGTGAKLPRGHAVSAPPLGDGNYGVWGEEIGISPDDAEQMRRFGII